jgi:colicin import membrane protein
LRLDWTISASAHLVALVAGSLTFTPARLPVPQVESIPVNIVSTSDTSQMAQGLKTAPQQEKPAPFAERIGEKKTAADPTAKIAKNEITASTDTPTPAPPPKAAKKKAEPKRDLIADALKKDDARKSEQKKVEANTPMPPKRPPQPQHKFDPRQVAELIDRRVPQRQETAGDRINDVIGAGTPKGTAAQLSQDELDALRARLAQLWNPPAGAQNPQELVVQVRLQLRPDGTLAAPPRVLTSGNTPLFIAARESAMRAVFRGQPFDMLRPENHEAWKDIEITFDPRDMIRG